MDKKDIYEHLAKIYLDASSKRKSKSKKDRPHLKLYLIASVVFILSVTGLSINYFLNRQKGVNSEIALFISQGAVKINFNFDPAKREIFSLNLNNLDLSRFRALGFSLRKANFKDAIFLKVEFVNNFRERSEFYLKDISHKWQEHKLDFSEFKKMSQWSNMQSISFAVEEWNTKEKSGVVYIDNIRFLNKKGGEG